MKTEDFQAAVEDILALPRWSLKPSDSRDTIESWSSVADVQMVAFISAEIGLEPDAELMEAETFGDIVHALTERGALTC